MNVGLLGAGHVADQYVAGMAPFGELQLVAAADRDRDRCRRRAAQWGVRAIAPEDLLAADDVELVVNLTPPSAHAETSAAALLAGKHVYSEKPLATSVDRGRMLLELARERGLGLGCAPDTFLGSAIETAHKAVASGAIGTPVAAHAFVGNTGPEAWHPAPQSYYEPGAGPLFSLGPYYLTALVQLLGPIADTAAFASCPSPRSNLRSAAGIRVATQTTYAAAVRFVSGAIATMFASYDVNATGVPSIEIFGADATLALPDPNHFDGPVLVGTRAGWRELPVTSPTGYGRGVGVADLVRAISNGGVARSNGELALHVLDALSAIDDGGRPLETRPCLARS